MLHSTIFFINNYNEYKIPIQPMKRRILCTNFNMTAFNHRLQGQPVKDKLFIKIVLIFRAQSQRAMLKNCSKKFTQNSLFNGPHMNPFSLIFYLCYIVNDKQDITDYGPTLHERRLLSSSGVSCGKSYIYKILQFPVYGFNDGNSWQNLYFFIQIFFFSSAGLERIHEFLA